MNRETGVTTFFSPAAQKDMALGYSFVPRTGWGVMIPPTSCGAEGSGGACA